MNWASIAERYDLRALGVIGSRARGDHSPHSDLDLVGVGRETGFQSFREPGVVVELHVVRDIGEWAAKPSWWYALREVRVVIDDGTLAKLPGLVDEWQQGYRVPADEIRRNRGWLESLVRKLRGAKSPLGAAFLVNTNTWQILAGAFLARNMPVPASSHMLRLAPGAIGGERFRVLMMGTLDERVQVALELSEEIVGVHRGTLVASDPGSTTVALRLQCCSLEQIRLLRENPRALGLLDVLEGALPPPGVLKAAERAISGDAEPAWIAPWLFILEGTDTVVGSGGFKGAPSEGRVEVGYGVAESCRRRGYATAGLRLLVRAAFRAPSVLEVVAETGVENVASRRVVQKAGFVHTGRRECPQDGLLDVWTRARHEGEDDTR